MIGLFIRVLAPMQVFSFFEHESASVVGWRGPSFSFQYPTSPSSAPSAARGPEFGCRSKGSLQQSVRWK